MPRTEAIDIDYSRIAGELAEVEYKVDAGVVRQLLNDYGAVIDLGLSPPPMIGRAVRMDLPARGGSVVIETDRFDVFRFDRNKAVSRWGVNIWQEETFNPRSTSPHPDRPVLRIKPEGEEMCIARRVGFWRRYEDIAGYDPVTELNRLMSGVKGF